jgi:DNA-binding NarL/FixJ family response regulator
MGMGAASRMGGEARLPDNRRMGPTILIVDDHPSFRASARRLLEADGYEVVGEALDGESAFEAVRELRPEIVLLDVQLPGLDGFEVAARLTNGGGGPAVVLTSSRDASDVAPYAAASGARGFVPKSELSGEALAAILR